MGNSKSYKDLEVYKLSLELFFKTHRFSLKMPKYETYELGSQVRRSADSINSNIVEGYGRKNYKNDFIKFLTYSHSSNDETKNHILKIKTLYPNLEKEGNDLLIAYDKLGIKIHNFLNYVKNNWKT